MPLFAYCLFLLVNVTFLTTSYATSCEIWGTQEANRLAIEDPEGFDQLLLNCSDRRPESNPKKNQTGTPQKSISSGLPNPATAKNKQDESLIADGNITSVMGCGYLHFKPFSGNEIESGSPAHVVDTTTCYQGFIHKCIKIPSKNEFGWQKQVSRCTLHQNPISDPGYLFEVNNYKPKFIGTY